MKKLLLIGAVMVSAISFANGHGGMGTGMNNTSGGNMTCKMMGNKMGGNHMMGMNMTPELKKEMQNDMIKIQEKQLEINKIMNTSNPNMKKVESLNKEIYQIKANHMTKMQQNMTQTN